MPLPHALLHVPPPLAAASIQCGPAAEHGRAFSCFYSPPRVPPKQPLPMPVQTLNSRRRPSGGNLGPNQLAWLRANVPAFKPAETQANEARRHATEVERKLKRKF